MSTGASTSISSTEEQARALITTIDEERLRLRVRFGEPVPTVLRCGRDIYRILSVFPDGTLSRAGETTGEFDLTTSCGRLRVERQRWLPPQVWVLDWAIDLAPPPHALYTPVIRVLEARELDEGMGYGIEVTIHDAGQPFTQRFVWSNQLTRHWDQYQRQQHIDRVVAQCQRDWQARERRRYR